MCDGMSIGEKFKKQSAQRDDGVTEVKNDK